MTETKEAEETGFVFIDANGKPFFVTMWKSSLWLFYWSDSKMWLSKRKLDPGEIPALYVKRLPPDKADQYHNVHLREKLKKAP